MQTSKEQEKTKTQKKLLGFDIWMEIKNQVVNLIDSTNEAKVFIENRDVISPDRIIRVFDEMHMREQIKKHM